MDYKKMKKAELIRACQERDLIIELLRRDIRTTRQMLKWIEGTHDTSLKSTITMLNQALEIRTQEEQNDFDTIPF